jgi:hypothetical protein
MTIKMISEREHGISFEGSPREAMDFAASLREAEAFSGLDMPKALNDLVFKLEMALQNAGYLDEGFNPINREG